MKRIVQTFLTYEEANDAQITLLAGGIDCAVDRESRHIWDIEEGKNPRFDLKVDVSDFEGAKKLLTRYISDDYVPLIQCPHCQSARHRRYSYMDSPWFYFTWFFLLPAIWAMYVMKKEGRRYECLDCHRQYRVKL